MLIEFKQGVVTKKRQTLQLLATIAATTALPVAVHASGFTDPAAGNMTLWVNTATGDVELVGNQIAFTGYEVQSTGNLLVGNWTKPMTTSFGWGVLGDTTSTISEGTLGAGVNAVDTSPFNLGNIFNVSAPHDFVFSYTNASNGTYTANVQYGVPTLTWDPGLSPTTPGSDGAGNWDTTTAIWSNGSTDQAWTNGFVASIGANGTGNTITIDAAGITATGITFNSLTTGQYTIAAASGDNLTLSGDITLNANATISAPIVGTGAITIVGPDTLTLSGANTFTGGITFNSGILSVSSEGNLGGAANPVTFNGGELLSTALFLTDSRAITLDAASGTTIDIHGGQDSFSGIISGSGTFTILDSAPITTSSITLAGANTYTGGTVLNSTHMIITADNNLGASTGTITLNNSQLETRGVVNTGRNIILSGTGDILNSYNELETFSGVISGTAPLTVTNFGGGVLAFSGTNTYTGGTIIQDGVLAVSTDANLGASSGSITLQGGTLKTLASLTTARSVVLASGGSSGGYIDTDGAHTDTFSGVISGPTSLDIEDSTLGSSGKVVFSGANTYIGLTKISQGTLALSGTGTIADSSYLQIITGAVFDISATTGGATVKSFGGYGNINLGAQPLTENIASVSVADFDGVMSGTGSFTLSGTGGIQFFKGINTYTGATIINDGTLALSHGGSIAASSGVTFNLSTSVLDISQAASGETVKALSGSLGTVALGSQTLTINGTGSSVFDGVIQTSGPVFGNGTGGGLTVTAGTQTLGGVNIYTGATTITGGTLALSGPGSIADSSGVVLSSGGTFDISGTTSGATILGLTGTGGTVNLGGKTLSLALPTSQTDTFNGILEGTGGGLTLSGTSATEVLGGTNTYSGTTTINSGTLEFTGSTASLTGGIVNDANLNFQQTASSSFSGVISGTGTLTQNGSAGTTLTLSGANTASGPITITAGTLKFTGSTAGLGGNLTDNSALVFAQTASSNLTGAISGTGTVTQSGSAGTTLTLAGNNTYSGTTTITSGTLELSGLTAGMTGGIVNNSALLFQQAANNSFSGVVSGTGTLTENGATGTTLTLSGANTYTGGTTLENGVTVKLRNTTSSTSNFGTGAITIGPGGATMQFGAAGITVGNAIALNANVTLDGGAFTDVYSGNITGAAAYTFALQNGTIYLTASNASTFTNGTMQIGNGSPATNVIFGFNNSNNLPGNGATIALNTASLTQARAAGPNGELVDGSPNTISNPITLTGANTINTGTLFNLTLAGNITGTGSLAVNGDGISNGSLIITGTDTYSGGTTIFGGGGFLGIGNGGTTGSISGNVAMTGNADIAFDHSDNITFGGVISGGGYLVQRGTGTLTLTNTNTYSDATYIRHGTLALSGSGSIADSSQVGLYGNPGVTLDISGASGTETINNFNGAGGSSVSLGANTLAVNITGSGLNGFQGVMSGTGGLTLTAGSGGGVTLSGANTFTGATTISSGTLALSGTGSIADSSSVILDTGGTANSTFDISALTNGGASIKSLASTSVGAGSGTASVLLGTNSLTIANGSGNFAGVISGTGGLTINAGTQTLTGVNTYSGVTSVSSGTLALSGTGSVADSSRIAISPGGTFDISATTSGATVLGLAGIGGTVNLVSKTLSVTLPTSQTDTFNGIIEGVGGGLTLSGTSATEILGGTNTYSGTTTIASGTLEFTGSTASLTGGIVNNSALVFQQTASSSLSGAISGTGGVTENGSAGTALTLTGANTYTGPTSINSGQLMLVTGAAITSTSALTIAPGATVAINSTGASDGITINYTAGNSPNATIRNEIIAGYSGGTWTGTSTTGGVITSTVAAGNNQKYAVGYADGADGVVAGLGSTQEKVMLTLAGDATLAGKVTLNDFTIWLNNYGTTSGAQWDQGDFNYDGKVNLQDFTVWLDNYGQSLSPGVSADAPMVINNSQAAPEPQSFAFAVVGISPIFLLKRRRRLGRHLTGANR